MQRLEFAVDGFVMGVGVGGAALAGLHRPVSRAMSGRNSSWQAKQIHHQRCHWPGLSCAAFCTMGASLARWVSEATTAGSCRPGPYFVDRPGPRPGPWPGRSVGWRLVCTGAAFAAMKARSAGGTCARPAVCRWLRPGRCRVPSRSARPPWPAWWCRPGWSATPWVAGSMVAAVASWSWYWAPRATTLATTLTGRPEISLRAWAWTVGELGWRSKLPRWPASSLAAVAS